MAPERAFVAVELHALDVTPGAWCGVCALPSAVRVEMALVDPSTLLVVGHASAVRCLECGTQVAVPT